MVAASGRKQKRAGKLTDYSKDEFKPVDPRSNVTQTERPRTRDRKVEPKLETSMVVTDGVANRAVADIMLELFKLYTVCIAEAEGVTAVVQTELDDRAKSHGIFRSMVSKMTERMLDIWTNTTVESGTAASLSHYQEAKKRWKERQQQLRLATSQFSDQVLEAGD